MGLLDPMSALILATCLPWVGVIVDVAELVAAAAAGETVGEERWPIRVRCVAARTLAVVFVFLHFLEALEFAHGLLVEDIGEDLLIDDNLRRHPSE